MTRSGVFRRFLRYVAPYRWWVLLAFTSTFVVAVGNGALAGLIRPLFDDVLVQQQAAAHNPEESAAVRMILKRDLPEGKRGPVVNAIDRTIAPIEAWWKDNEAKRWKLVLWIIVIVYVFRSAAMFFSEYSFEKVGLSTVRDIRNDLYESIINQSFRFFARKPTGELVSRIVSDVEMIQSALSIRMSDLFQHSATLLVLVLFVVLVNTELAIICFIVAPVIIGPVLHFATRMRRASHKTQERMADVAMFLEETIKGVRIVKAFGMEKFETDRFRTATQRHLDINLKSRKIQAMSSPVMELIGGVCAVLLIGYAAYRIKLGVMSIGQFFSFVVALTMMYTPIKRLNKANLAINAAITATQRVFETIDTENEVREKPNAFALEGVGTGIEYRNVSFAYDSAPVLSSVNLIVSPGEMVAIVGTSGAGKTTLVNLLPRFYDVTDGAVLVDGHDVRDVSMASLRALIGVVTQETVLFNDSVRSNIAYGRLEVDEDELRSAARAANAIDFIEALPSGFDTWIGESGVLLSGGQRQRLAIARAIMKDPPILILDEATSALDTESERLVQQALANLMAGRTTLVIAHRLSTIRRANRIIALDAGEIRETGSHEELLARGGIYQRLYEMQFADDEPSNPGH